MGVVTPSSLNPNPSLLIESVSVILRGILAAQMAESNDVTHRVSDHVTLRMSDGVTIRESGAAQMAETYHVTLCMKDYVTLRVSGAAQMAEEAFQSPSILAQLSFPISHKLAIYLPFFLPVSLPIIVNTIRELRRPRKIT